RVDQGEEPAENTRPNRLEQRDGLMVRSGGTVKRRRRLALSGEVRVTQFDRDLRGNRVGGTVECQRAEAVRAGDEESENVSQECGAIVRRGIGFGYGIEWEGEKNHAPVAAGPEARIAQPRDTAGGHVVENRICICRNCERV